MRDISICTSISISSMNSSDSNTRLFFTSGRDDFLGISIVGQNFCNGDCNLFVGAVIPGWVIHYQVKVVQSVPTIEILHEVQFYFIQEWLVSSMWRFFRIRDLDLLRTQITLTVYSCTVTTSRFSMIFKLYWHIPHFRYQYCCLHCCQDVLWVWLHCTFILRTSYIPAYSYLSRV